MAGSSGMGVGTGMSGMYGVPTGTDMETSGVFAMGMEGIPLVDIDDPHDVDVLCGRGGASLKHPGNLTYRRLVHMNKGYYISCLKTEKFKISQSIVSAIRDQRGRFLERDGNKGTWYDIGDKKAIEKTSQALREGQPKLRQQIVEMGAGHPGMGLEFKVTPPFIAAPMLTPTMVLSPAAIQQQLAQQQMAQQHLLAQQRIIQQQMVQQQFVQQQMARQQQLLAQHQEQPKVLSPPASQKEQDPALHSVLREQLSIAKAEPWGPSTQNVKGDDSQAQPIRKYNDAVAPNDQGHHHTPISTTSIRQMDDISEIPLRRMDETTKPQQQDTVEIYSPHNKMEDEPYPYLSSQELHTNSASHAIGAAKGDVEDIERLFLSSGGFSGDGQGTTSSYTNQTSRAEKPPLHQADAQQSTLAYQTEQNGNAMRILDRRRIFARMKYSRPPSFGKLNNRSTASLGVDDVLQDIHMMGSTFSLLSNISSNQDMKLEDFNISSRSVQKLRDDHMVLGSRRSLMSGLSKISDSTDVHSMFSDLSRKIANMSTQSIPMSDVSGIEEGRQEDLDESLHIDPIAMANSVHMNFDG